MRTRLLLVAALAASPAIAQSGPPAGQGAGGPNAARQAFMKACQADIQKHCTGVQPGGGAIVQCLSEKKDALSPDCSKAVEQARGRMQQNGGQGRPGG